MDKFFHILQLVPLSNSLALFRSLSLSFSFLLSVQVVSMEIWSAQRITTCECVYTISTYLRMCIYYMYTIHIYIQLCLPIHVVCSAYYLMAKRKHTALLPQQNTEHSPHGVCCACICVMIVTECYEKICRLNFQQFIHLISKIINFRF